MINLIDIIVQQANFHVKIIVRIWGSKCILSWKLSGIACTAWFILFRVHYAAAKGLDDCLNVLLAHKANASTKDIAGGKQWFDKDFHIFTLFLILDILLLKLNIGYVWIQLNCYFTQPELHLMQILQIMFDVIKWCNVTCMMLYLNDKSACVFCTGLLTKWILYAQGSICAVCDEMVICLKRKSLVKSLDTTSDIFCIEPKTKCSFVNIY